MSLLNLRLLLCLLGLTALVSLQSVPESSNLSPAAVPKAQDESGVKLLESLNLNESPLRDADQAKIASLTTTLQASEWLGPLAPIAVSPFFGITILAGLSQFGDGFFNLNSFISDNPVLSNPLVFYVFLVLTIVTSVPKFTKVSKPFAQLVDQLEAYAGIATIIIIKVVSSIDTGPAVPEVAVVQMGALSFTTDLLFSIAAIVNILVINGIKCFFEVAAWLVPFPFVDAILEVTNKSLCAGLMSIYAWSPTVATIINLALFVVCLLAFRWTQRRLKFMRSMLIDPLLASLFPSWGQPKHELTVFPKEPVGAFPARVRLLLTRVDAGWQLVQPRWFLPPRVLSLPESQCTLQVKPGMLVNALTVKGATSNSGEPLGNVSFNFSRRHQRHLGKLSEQLAIAVDEASRQQDVQQEFGTI